MSALPIFTRIDRPNHKTAAHALGNLILRKWQKHITSSFCGPRSEHGRNQTPEHSANKCESQGIPPKQEIHQFEEHHRPIQFLRPGNKSRYAYQKVLLLLNHVKPSFWFKVVVSRFACEQEHETLPCHAISFPVLLSASPT